MRSPWSKVSQPDPGGEVVVMASRLQLANHLTIPSFILSSLAIMRQLRGSDGVIGFALDAQLLSATFLTLSVWRDNEALRAFSAADPHGAIATRYRPAMKASVFRTWTIPVSSLPIHWDDARDRLATTRLDA